jgi:hypothetical protein
MADTTIENKKPSVDDLVNSVTTIDTASLLQKAKDQYAGKYSGQLAQMIEDNARLERALKFVRESIKKVVEGDVLAIEDYIESRRKLERE